jgi:hypothetical protein
MDVLKAVSVDEIVARGAIRDSDVLKLRRMFNADARIDRDEAEKLITLNRACAEQDPAWIDCFVEMLTDHVVNQTSPEGYVTYDNAEWLVARISIEDRIATRAELELLINILDKSRWSPQSLAEFTLRQVLDAILYGTGPLRTGAAAETAPGRVTDADVEVLRRILYAFGGDGNIAITRMEADVLFEINDATVEAENADGWRDLFVKAVANCVLAASGYTAPSREQALAREAWLEKRGELSLSGMLSAYRRMSREEQAIARLERQKIEIITREEVTAGEAQWLAERLGRDGALTANEQALIAFLKGGNPALHDSLAGLLDKIPAAA